MLECLLARRNKQYIEGWCDVASTTLTFKPCFNGSAIRTEITVDVDEDGYWRYELPEGVYLNSLNYAFRFTNCDHITKIRFSDNFDFSRLTDLSASFGGSSGIWCIKLEEIEGLKITSACVNLNYAFGRTSLKTIDTNGWDTSNVRNWDYFFYSQDIYGHLESIDTSGWDTSAATSFRYVFYNQTDLTELDTSNWRFPNVTTIEATFANCKSLRTIGGVSNLGISNKCTSMYIMFYQCFALEDVIDLSSSDLSGITTIREMFTSCYKLPSITFGENVLHTKTLGNAFRECKSLTTLDVHNIKVDNCTSLYGVFYGCINLESVDIRGWNELGINLSDDTRISMNYLFNNCQKLNTIRGVEDINTSKVNLMDGVFYQCAALTSLDLRGWDVSNVTSFSSFLNMNSLVDVIESVDIRGWNTSNATNFYSMFRGCSGVSETGYVKLYASTGFTTENATTVNRMFHIGDGRMINNFYYNDDITDWSWLTINEGCDTVYFCNNYITRNITAIGDISASWDTSLMFVNASFLPSLKVIFNAMQDMTGKEQPTLKVRAVIYNAVQNDPEAKALFDDLVDNKNWNIISV